MLYQSWQYVLCSLAVLNVIGENLLSLVGRSVLALTDSIVLQVVTVSLTTLFQPKIRFFTVSVPYMLFHIQSEMTHVSK